MVVAGNQRQVTNDEALRMYLGRFFIGGIGADIAVRMGRCPHSIQRARNIRF
jgi:hypothetical protein